MTDMNARDPARRHPPRTNDSHPLASGRSPALLLVCALLAACGGGSGGGDDEPAPSGYSLGGTVSGLSGTLVLTNTVNNDSITLTANGSFTFPTRLDPGDSYNVAATTQPAAGCSVSNGAGTAAANVSSVTVSCTVIDQFTLAYRSIKTFRLLWPAVTGATYYRLFEDPDGASGYTRIGGDIAGTFYDHVLDVPLWERLNARYVLQACNDVSGCGADSSPVFVAGTLAGAVGYVKASNTDTTDYFGVAVALSADGGTLAVGARLEDSAATGINGNQADNSLTATGAVYVYVRTAGTWAQQAYIKSSVADAGDTFGSTVALSADGNTLAVGAYLEDSASTVINGNLLDDSATDSGAVYVYTRSGTVWSSPPTYIKPANTGVGDWFGSALALSGDGDTLAVGAHNEDSATTVINGDATDNNASNSGAVYVFARAGGAWSQQAYVKAANADATDDFGWAVALSFDGDRLAVGAKSEDSAATVIDGDAADDTAADAGAAYVFERVSGVWSQQAYIKAANAQQLDRFGSALALSSDGATLAVGAYLEDGAGTGAGGDAANNDAPNAGAAYVFVESGGSWTQQAYLKASNTAVSDEFGYALALSADGDRLAVGARLEDSDATGLAGSQADNGETIDSGAVYVFDRAGSDWAQQAYVKASNTDAADEFGYVLAFSGDGDTLAAGAYLEDSAATGIGGDATDDSAALAGAVYLY